jgi:hypothetical protein
MLRNYIIIAIRNLRRNKLHAFINIIGLTIGFACFIIISLWIVDEYSYDKSLVYFSTYNNSSIWHQRFKCPLYFTGFTG